MPYGEAYDWLVNGKAPKENSQIAKEIAWSLHYYGDLKSAMALCYDRVALYSREDSGLRITFDTNIRFGKSKRASEKAFFGSVCGSKF